MSGSPNAKLAPRLPAAALRCRRAYETKMLKNESPAASRAFCSVGLGVRGGRGLLAKTVLLGA